MDKFEALRAFTQVVTHRSFSGAAKKLGLSRSTLSKAVAQLEKNLGVQLLQRTTRVVSPTENGLTFYERCLEILANLQEAEAELSAWQNEPRGRIRLNAPMSFGTQHLSKAIAAFALQAPEVTVEAILNDRMVEPVQEGFDLTLRIAALEDSALMAKKIAPARRLLCASPAYLKKHGAPVTPRELPDHPCLHYGNLTTGNFWELRRGDRTEKVLIGGPICSNNGEFLQECARQGLGIVLLPTFMVCEDLRANRLVPLLKDWLPPEIHIYALYPAQRFLPAKVRALIDFLVTYFGNPPYWDQVSFHH